MNRTPWHLLVVVPAGIIALGFMFYTFRLFKPEHILMAACVLSDVALATIILHVLIIALPDPVKRAALLVSPLSRSAIILIAVGSILATASLCLHLFSGVAILNTQDYLLIGVVPLLLTLFNKFF